MKEFMDEDFLLKTETAKTLYHQYAKEMPICDYHCHLNAKEIAEDKKYQTITELWLSGDHYKWRAMRLFGVDEKYITGSAPDFEKFEKFAETIEYSIGNPLYHWTHLELRRYFGIYEILSPKTAKEIYEKANEKLKTLSAREFIQKSNVLSLCTTDDPLDSLNHHISLAKEWKNTKVLPTFRPDKVLEIASGDFLPYLEKFEKTIGKTISTNEDFKTAIKNRIAFFKQNGCLLSDHSFGELPYIMLSDAEIEAVFQKAKNSEIITKEEADGYRLGMMIFLANCYHEENIAMQLHIGAMRNNNSNMKNKLGADSGFDSICDKEIAEGLSKFLNEANKTGLPKTIIYTLNPKDNYVFASMMGNFASETNIPTKVQFGSAWWFSDQKQGIEDHIKAFSNLGLISKFVGMLTDSRSFTSYPRHEYFRRILCEYFGDLVENGEFPCDMPLLGKIVEDICYNNINNFLNAKENFEL